MKWQKNIWVNPPSPRQKTNEQNMVKSAKTLFFPGRHRCCANRRLFCWMNFLLCFTNRNDITVMARSFQNYFPIIMKPITNANQSQLTLFVKLLCVRFRFELNFTINKNVEIQLKHFNLNTCVNCWNSNLNLNYRKFKTLIFSSNRTNESERLKWWHPNIYSSALPNMECM